MKGEKYTFLFQMNGILDGRHLYYNCPVSIIKGNTCLINFFLIYIYIIGKNKNIKYRSFFPKIMQKFYIL